MELSQIDLVIGKLSDLLIANGEQKETIHLSDLEIIRMAILMIDKDRQKKALLKMNCTILSLLKDNDNGILQFGKIIKVAGMERRRSRSGMVRSVPPLMENNNISQRLTFASLSQPSDYYSQYFVVIFWSKTRILLYKRKKDTKKTQYRIFNNTEK